MIRPAATKTRLTLIDDRHEFLDILSERLNRRDTMLPPPATERWPCAN